MEGCYTMCAPVLESIEREMCTDATHSSFVHTYSNTFIRRRVNIHGILYQTVINFFENLSYVGTSHYAIVTI